MNGAHVAEGESRSGAPSWHELLKRLRSEGELAGRRLLLLDSDPGSREIFRQFAQAAECGLDCAEDGATAFSLSLEYRYDVIVVPLTTPFAELLAPLRALQSNAAFLLAREATQDDASAIPTSDVGVAGLVNKPWSQEQLGGAVERALRLSHARASYSSELRASAQVEYSLLVVDSVLGFEQLRESLNREGVTANLTHAPTLGEAARQLATHAFDAVLTELSLPDAWGLDSVVELCASTQSAPVLVYTELDDAALLSEAIQLGAQDVWLKSHTHSGIEKTLKSAIERQHARSKLAHLAHHDGLTKLANRTLFRQRLAEATARSRRKGGLFAVMYLDLDHFKPINDALGHAAGDSVLETVGRRLRSAVREYDTVARLGGDEFAVLLDTLEHRDEAGVVAERIRQKLREPVCVGEASVSIACSIGIAMYPDAGERPEDLLQAADRQMYIAKRGKENSSRQPQTALRLVQGGAS